MNLHNKCFGIDQNRKNRVGTGWVFLRLQMALLNVKCCCCFLYIEIYTGIDMVFRAPANFTNLSQEITMYLKAICRAHNLTPKATLLNPRLHCTRAPAQNGDQGPREPRVRSRAKTTNPRNFLNVTIYHIGIRIDRFTLN